MSFRCKNCGKDVITHGDIGTKNRNHCPFCLYSLHLDESFPGDRKALCKGIMVPVGICFKKEKKDKYGNERIGEIMIIHECSICSKKSKNRIASDDSSEKIIELAKKKVNGKELKEINRQLFGE